MIPERLQEDARELGQVTGCRVSLVENGGRILVIVEKARLPAGTYTADRSDVLMITDHQYPMSAMDMFYLEESVHHTRGPIPDYAKVIEEYVGRKWRRWSRHRNGIWKPNVDGLLSHWAFVEATWAEETTK